jgi:hypothetical protein
MQKINRVRERLRRANELYDSIFSAFQRKVLDSSRIRNVLKLYFMVKMSRELETAEAFFYLREATRLYNDSFSASTRMLDDDPVGNVITLAQYMMEAKEPTRQAATTEELMAMIIDKPDEDD